MSDAQLACLDGEIMPLAEARVPVSDEGLLRGDGVFEALRLYDGRAFAFEAHMERLARSAENLRLPVDLEAVRAEAHRFLAAAAGEPSREVLRVILTRGGRRLLITEPLPRYDGPVRLRSVVYSPTLVLDGVKSLSYAGNMLASRLARERGADEALLVTPHGRVLEAPTSSIFWVKEEDIFTPPLSEHILASITRALVMDLTAAQEQPCTLEDLFEADEVFLTSTTCEVQRGRTIAAHTFTPDGPVTARLALEASARIQGELANA